MSLLLASPQKYYWREVLGIREVLIPESASGPSSWKVEGELPTAEVIAFFAEPWTAAQQELWQRLSEALKISRALLLSGRGSEGDLSQVLNSPNLKGIVFGSRASAELGLGKARPGERHSWAGVQWCVTHALNDMLGGGPQVAATKRETWGHLQEYLK